MDPLTVVMLAVLAVLIFFMFRNSRKRQRDLASLQEQIVPGAEIMTNFGLFGTIVSMDNEENKYLLETSPGTVITLHRQTIAKVVEPVVAEADSEDADVVAGNADAPAIIDLSAPEFGERTTSDESGPSRVSSKKIDE